VIQSPTSFADSCHRGRPLDRKYPCRVTNSGAPHLPGATASPHRSAANSQTHTASMTTAPQLPKIPEDASPDMPITLTASVVLTALPRDGKLALDAASHPKPAKGPSPPLPPPFPLSFSSASLTAG